MVLEKAEDSNISVADVDKLSIETVDLKEVDGVKADRANKSGIGIINPAEVDGVDKPDTDSADLVDPVEVDRADKLGTSPADLANPAEVDKVDKPDTGTANPIEVDGIDKPSIGLAAKNLRRQLAKKQVVIGVFFYSFYKVAYLFFSSSELETSNSLAIS